jgi:S1-C subfamily serine protease/uncharacterized RDD family membrane protein YckC
MFCRNCGKEITGIKNFCKHCGYKNQINSFYPAGFFIRLGAFLIDIIIVIILLLIFVSSVKDWGESFDGLFFIIGIILYNIIFVSLVSTTPGKALMGLKVLKSQSYEKAGIGRIILRTILYLISFGTIGIGILYIALDRKNHFAFHDKLSKTQVYKTSNKKTLGIILSVISGILFSLIILARMTPVDEPYPIRKGTRQIKNELKINEDLFIHLPDWQSNRNKTNNDSFGITTTPPNIFDINKELAAVVAISCPNKFGIKTNQGSGVIITEGGLILTNYHVIKSMDKQPCEIGITNDLSQEPEFMYYAKKATVPNEVIIMENEQLDTAILQITDSMPGFKLPLKFPAISYTGSSDLLNINDKVYVAGYPSYGSNTITYTDGVVSGRVGDDLIKTSAKIDYGNSGGAVFNENGEYVGIPTLIYKGGFEGLGYFIGIDSVKDWIKEYNIVR